MNDKNSQTLIKVINLRKWYPVKVGFTEIFSRKKKRYVRAVNNISFEIKKKEIFGLIGESGSGKTTVGELLVRLQIPTDGQILFNGEDINLLRKEKLKEFYQNAQIIFQDPYETLNPRFTTLTTVSEPLKIHFPLLSDKERMEKIMKVLEQVELSPPEDFLNKYPHEMSGGQRQRVSIARAIVLSPIFLVADEPTSMLDVSIRASILNLFKSFKQSFGLSTLYISHDLSTVSYLCNRVAIMYLGKLLEVGFTDEILEEPYHPYTKALISAVPIVDPDVKRKRILVKGDIPDPIDLPSGCPFWPRCNDVMDICKKEMPKMRVFKNKRRVACHLF